MQTQGRPRTVCAKSAAVETTGTVAKSSRQDPEVAEGAGSTRTGRAPDPVTTMVATVVVRVAATDHATGCLMALGTAVEEVAAVKAAGDRDGGTLARSER